MSKAIGLLEAFSLIREVGRFVLDLQLVKFSLDCEKRKGCRLMGGKMTREEKNKILALGMQCKQWKKENR